MDEDETRKQVEEDAAEDLEVEDKDAEQVAGGGPRKAGGENPTTGTTY